MSARIIMAGSGRHREIELGQELTIGRAYSNLLRLEGDEISRVHAIIYRRGVEYVVRDLDSKNGVHVNGQKVSTSVLKSGDEIRVGQFFLLFDPQPEHDVAAFLKKHDVEPEVPAEPPIEPDLRTMVLSKTDSVKAIGGSEEKVFFKPEDATNLAKTIDGDEILDMNADLLRISMSVAEADPDEEGMPELPVAQILLRAFVHAVNASRGVVILRDGREELKLAAILPLETDVAVNRVVLRGVLKESLAVMCNNVPGEEQFHKTETVKREQIGSLIAHPLLRGDKVVGLIYADVISRENAFRPHHLALLNFVAKLLVLSVPTVPAPA